MAYTLNITTVGNAKIAAAISSGIPLNVSTMKLGSSDGALLTEASTGLGTQVWSALISSSTVSGGVMNFTSNIPATEGGWTIREIGLFDAVGALIAYAAFPATYKGVVEDGYGSSLTITAQLVVSNVSAITVQVSSSVVSMLRDASNVVPAERAAIRANLGIGNVDATVMATPKQGLLFNGSSAGRGVISLKAPVGSGDFTLSTYIDVPLVNPASTLGVFGFNTGAFSSVLGSMSLVIGTDGTLNLWIVGSNVAYYRVKTMVGFVASFSGQRVFLSVVRTGATVDFYIGGSLLTSTDAAFGATPPAWGASITITNLIFGAAGADVPFSGFISPLLLINKALTLSELQALAGTGTIPSKWCYPTNATSAGQYPTGTHLTTLIIPGCVYRIASVGTTTTWASVGATVATVGTVFTATAAGTGDGVVEVVGAMLALDQMQRGIGCQWLDMSNFKAHLKFAFTGTQSPLDTAWAIRTHGPATIYASHAATGNTQLLGQMCLPPRSRILSWTIDSSVSGTLILGTTSGASDLLGSTALGAGRTAVPLLTQFCVAGNLWASFNNAGLVKHTIVYEIFDEYN